MILSPLLECRDLRAGYGVGNVLQGMSLDVNAGEVVTLLGLNGVGKSTTIKTIVGLLKPTGGEIRFDGRPITAQDPDATARAGIAVVPEGRQCFPNLTVEEHLTAFSRNSRGHADPWTLDRIYQLFPKLSERARHLGSQLSGGEQQMLAIGRALSTNPALLIMDEATEGLAPVIREEIWRCLVLLRSSGQTILLVDKYVRQLMKIADRHFVMQRGKVVWSGSSDELRNAHSVWDQFLTISSAPAQHHTRREG